MKNKKYIYTNIFYADRHEKTSTYAILVKNKQLWKTNGFNKSAMLSQFTENEMGQIVEKANIGKYWKQW